MACHLRVGVLPIPIYSIIKSVNKSIQVTGLTDIMFTMVKEVTNCTYSYHLPSVLSYGVRTPNGTLSGGLLADLQKNAIDITMPCVARNHERDVFAESTRPLFFLPMAIMGGRNTTQDTNMSGYLLTFDTQVWAILLVSLAVLSIVLTGLEVTQRKMWGLRTAVFDTWNDHFWRLFENIFWEASSRTPKPTSLRLITTAWWLAMLVLMNAFAGQLRACLMVKNEMKKINSMADIAATPYLKVYLLKDSSISRYMKTHTGEAQRAVWSRVQPDQTALHGLIGYPKDVLTQVAQGKAVTINALRVAQIEATKFCAQTQVGEFYFGKEHVTSYMFGSYMSRRINCDIRRRIEKVVVALRESGTAEFLEERDVAPLQTCMVAEQEDDLKLRDMASIFYLYTLCCAASGVVFLVELVFLPLTKHCIPKRQ